MVKPCFPQMSSGENPEDVSDDVGLSNLSRFNETGWNDVDNNHPHHRESNNLNGASSLSHVPSGALPRSSQHRRRSLRQQTHRNAVNTMDSDPPTDCTEGAVGYNQYDDQEQGLMQRPSHRSHSLGDMECSRCSRNNQPPGQLRRNSSPVPPRHATTDLQSIPSHNHFNLDTEFVCPSEVNPKTMALGSQLITSFFREEIRRQNLQEPPCLDPQRANCRSDLVEQQEVLSAFSALREVAQGFAQSSYRQAVRLRAEAVTIESLNFTSFSDLLFGLFQEGGVTYERVVVLFFFCSDLAIRALKRRLWVSFHNLISWSQHFTMTRLSLWIQEQGGWGAVLEHSVSQANSVAILGVCSVAIIALCIYIKNNW